MFRKVFKIIGIIVVILIVCVIGVLVYLKTALPDVGPAPKLAIRATPQMIARGAYLANHVTVCIDCHSERDWTRFAGPIVPGTEGQGGEIFDHGMGFPGTIYAKNITPANLKDWTDGDIYRTITTGVTKDGEALFPVMPYHFYSMMDPRDVDAIIAYVRTLKPITHPVPERKLDFPVNFIINTIPQKAHPTTRPAVTDTINYGHYMVLIAGCQECHTKQVQGKIVGKPFAGGWAFHLPGFGTVRSANLTPDVETGIGAWSKETFIHFFKSRENRSYNGPKVAPGQMQTVMPWAMYAGMDTTDLGAIYAYLHSIPPVKNKVVLFTPDSITTAPETAQK